MDLVDKENGSEITVDLEQQTVTLRGEVVAFPFDAFHRQRLLEGLDDIGLALRHETDIAAYEQSHPPRIDTLALG
jgi:3-isopropylmalate/(R)-2-methylmalate dehydratase small subunit